MLDQLLGSRCLQPNAVFVSAIYSTIYMKNGKVVYQITRESLNVVLLSPSSALFKSPPSPPMRFSPVNVLWHCAALRNPPAAGFSDRESVSHDSAAAVPCVPGRHLCGGHMGESALPWFGWIPSIWALCTFNVHFSLSTTNLPQI